MKKLFVFTATVALVAAAPAAAKKPQAPEIRTTEYALADQPGAVLIGATVSRAESVTATVGTGAASHRLQLAPADPGGRTTLWTAQETQGVEACLPVRFVARNAGGTAVERDESCVFGVSDPNPPSFHIPFIGLGRR